MSRGARPALSVLVVDDDEDFAESLALVIEDEGHTVTVANTLSECVATYGRRRFDLVMLDVRLRGESGVDCLEALRAVDPDVCAVMMTGYSVESVLQRALRMGARRVLRKPFGEGELMEVLASVS